MTVLPTLPDLLLHIGSRPQELDSLWSQGSHERIAHVILIFYLSLIYSIAVMPYYRFQPWKAPTLSAVGSVWQAPCNPRFGLAATSSRITNRLLGKTLVAFFWVSFMENNMDILYGSVVIFFLPKMPATNGSNSSSRVKTSVTPKTWRFFFTGQTVRHRMPAKDCSSNSTHKISYKIS